MGSQVKPEARQMIVDDIAVHVSRTHLPLPQILRWYGLHRSTYYRWFDAGGNVSAARKPRRKADTSLLPEEIAAVERYRHEQPEVGYRKLTWMMIDANIAYLSEISTYRLLKSRNLLHMGVSRTPADKEYKDKPKYVHHHWHTDIAYIKISQVFYYLIMMLDGFSRFLLNWSLMSDMTEHSVALFVQQTREKYPFHHPLLIMDNGSQFISKDFKNLLSAINLTPVHTRRAHPQTNGKMERMNGSVKSEAIRVCYPQTYQEGVEVIGNYEYFYNYQRLHAGIHYLRPADVFFGRADTILFVRKEKIMLARENRIRQNQLNRKE